MYNNTHYHSQCDIKHYKKNKNKQTLKNIYQILHMNKRNGSNPKYKKGIETKLANYLKTNLKLPHLHQELPNCESADELL